MGFLYLFDAGRNARCSQQPHLCPLGNQSSFFKKQFLSLGCRDNSLFSYLLTSSSLQVVDNEAGQNFIKVGGIVILASFSFVTTINVTSIQ